MKITVFSHDLSSNAVMRAHRLAKAGATFGDVRLVGPVHRSGPWGALPEEPWVTSTVPKARFPKFHDSFVRLVDLADGDVLIAVKPHLASFGTALVARELRDIPVVLDIDDLDTALAPRSAWAGNPSIADISRPGSAVYLSLLTRATATADAITVSSTALQRRFGGTVVPHGSDLTLFDPASLDRDKSRREFGFHGPTVLFPGTPRDHKGVRLLADAVAGVPDARLAVICRPKDLSGPQWEGREVLRLPLIPYTLLPRLLAAADVVAIPQLDTEPARYQMPMKVFDAMAMGRPIVASTVGDLPEVLDGCARLVPPGDCEALRRAIAELLGDPEEAADLGARGRDRCSERYSIERVGDALREVISRAAR